MPNGYTVVPNVLPGNVTIGGNLTVQGNTVQVGTAAPFVRVNKVGSNGGTLSYNLAADRVTRDVGGSQAFDFNWNEVNGGEAIRKVNTSGNAMDSAIPRTILTDYTLHQNTGNTTENTIYSKTIRANSLGANGALIVRLDYSFATQGATPSSIRLKIGAQTFFTDSAAAAADKYSEIVIFNKNSVSSQGENHRIMNVGTGAWTASFSSFGVDTSTDLSLLITAQCGTGTDQQNMRLAFIEQLNTFGPV